MPMPKSTSVTILSVLAQVVILPVDPEKMTISLATDLHVLVDFNWYVM